MCFGGGGSSNNSAQIQQQQQIADEQARQQQELSDQQIAAQKDIAAQQEAFNEDQAVLQKAQYDQQQAQAQQQADRQSTYDTGRAQALSEGAQKVQDAFAKFTPEYFQNYAKSYVSQTQDQIDYQKAQAQKQLAFGLARAGLSGSQAGINQMGVIDETAGRATADATAQATSAAAQLQQQVANARSNLLQQVASSQSIGSPIAGSTIQDVNSALDTQRSAISGVSNTAGDTASSFQAVPTVSTLGNIFANAITSGSNLLQGINAGSINQAVKAGLTGTDPNRTSA